MQILWPRVVARVEGNLTFNRQARNASPQQLPEPKVRQGVVEGRLPWSRLYAVASSIELDRVHVDPAAVTHDLKTNGKPVPLDLVPQTPQHIHAGWELQRVDS